MDTSRQDPVGGDIDEVPWRRASALVLVEDLSDPTLLEPDAHHLGRVLRLRSGTEVCAADGLGGWRICRFDGAAGLAASEESGHQSAPAQSLTVGFAAVKGDKPDLVVQKLTELGIDRIVLFEGRRSVVRWRPDKVERNLERLRRVARSACSQSRRLHVPRVEFATLQSLLADGAVVADFGGRSIRSDDRLVLIGPEGGWDAGEYGSASAVDLGDNVLRAETASISAAVQMGCHRRAIAHSQ